LRNRFFRLRRPLGSAANALFQQRKIKKAALLVSGACWRIATPIARSANERCAGSMNHLRNILELLMFYLNCFVGGRRRNNSQARRNHFSLVEQNYGNGASLSIR
jgi:hypothetical protein